MTTWIALLRGVNVGGKNILPMKELRATLQACGFDNVKTYIQSGNCVFEAESAEAVEVSGTVSAAINDRFGFRPEVMALKRAELAQSLEHNPFAARTDEAKTVHFYFLERPPEPFDKPAFDALKAETEQFALVGAVFYLWAPDGIGRSKLAAKAERLLGVPATARNLRSVLKITELVEELIE